MRASVKAIPNAATSVERNAYAKPEEIMCVCIRLRNDRVGAAGNRSVQGEEEEDVGDDD